MNDQRLHVMHILHRFAMGGLENGLVNLINRLPNERFCHTIVCLTDFDADFAQRLNNTDVNIISLHKPSGRSLKYLIALRQLMRDKRPHIVHSRGLAALEAQLASVLLPIRRIHGEHGWDSASAKHNKKYQLLRKLLSPLINGFVVLSKEGDEYLRDGIGINPNKINLICNGVDTDKFVPTAKGLTDKLIITTVGRLASVKNQQLLIEAMAKLVHHKQLHNIELRIVGEGECRDVLEEKIAQLKLSSHCFLLGERDDVSALLVQSDLFVLPSFAEGISNTILESMACGIPVVASSVGGNVELVADGLTGALFESDNVDSLVNALLPYLERPNLRQSHGNNARQRGVQNFSLNKMVDCYQQLYFRINTAI
mgnify:FL=1